VGEEGKNARKERRKGTITMEGPTWPHHRGEGGKEGAILVSNTNYRQRKGKRKKGGMKLEEKRKKKRGGGRKEIDKPVLREKRGREGRGGREPSLFSEKSGRKRRRNHD